MAMNIETVQKFIYEFMKTPKFHHLSLKITKHMKMKWYS